MVAKKMPLYHAAGSSTGKPDLQPSADPINRNCGVGVVLTPLFEKSPPEANDSNPWINQSNAF
jgi:hypothetical protein